MLAVTFTLDSCRLSRNSKHSCWYFWTFSVALLVSVGVSTLLEINLFTLKFMLCLSLQALLASKGNWRTTKLALDTNSYVTETWALRENIDPKHCSNNNNGITLMTFPSYTRLPECMTSMKCSARKVPFPEPARESVFIYSSWAW